MAKSTRNTYQKGRNNVSVENNEKIIINNNGTEEKSGLKILIPLLVIVVLLIGILSMIVIKSNNKRDQNNVQNYEISKIEADNDDFTEIKTELERLNSKFQKSEKSFSDNSLKKQVENNDIQPIQADEIVKTHTVKTSTKENGQQLNFANHPISGNEPIRANEPINQDSLSNLSEITPTSKVFNDSKEKDKPHKDYSGPKGDICIINKNFYQRKIVLINVSNEQYTELLIGKKDKACLYDFPTGIYTCEVYTTFTKKRVEKFQLKITDGKSINHKLNTNNYN